MSLCDYELPLKDIVRQQVECKQICTQPRRLCLKRWRRYVMMWCLSLQSRACFVSAGVALASSIGPRCECDSRTCQPVMFKHVAASLLPSYSQSAAVRAAADKEMNRHQCLFQTFVPVTDKLSGLLCGKRRRGLHDWSVKKEHMLILVMHCDPSLEPQLLHHHLLTFWRIHQSLEKSFDRSLMEYYKWHALPKTWTQKHFAAFTRESSNNGLFSCVVCKL